MNSDLKSLVEYRLEEARVQDGTFDREIARALSVAFDLRNKSDYRELASPSSGSI